MTSTNEPFQQKMWKQKESLSLKRCESYWFLWKWKHIDEMN